MEANNDNSGKEGSYKENTPLKISNKEYHSVPTRLSSSALKLAYKDFLSYKEAYIDKTSSFKSSPAMDLGTYLHARILEKDIVTSEFVTYKDGNRIGKTWQAFKEKNKDKTIVTQYDEMLGDALEKMVSEHPHTIKLLNGGESELSFFSSFIFKNRNGEDNKFLVKIRPDYLNIEAGYLCDIKTTSSSLDESPLQWTIERLNYDIAVTLYCQVLKEIYNKDFKYYFIFLSTREAGIMVKEADESVFKSGSEKMRIGLENILKFKNGDQTILDTIPKISMPIK